MSKWVSAKISDESHNCLKIASALLKKDMRELGSQAVMEFCTKVIQQHTKKMRNSSGK